MFKRPSDGFWAGLVAGILIVTLLMYFDVNVNEPPKSAGASPILTSASDAQSFVNAWQRMASGTWSVTSSYTRRLVTGATYTAVLKSIQLPPNYLSQSVGSTSASINGRNYVCASINNGKPTGCRDTGAALPFDTAVAQQVDAVRKLVSGPSPRYEVGSTGNNCYRLILAPGATATSWGNQATFCFDPATGAQTKSEIDQDGGIDTTQAINVSGTPNPQDLQVPHS